MKISNLLNRDFKIVEKRKVLFLIPVAIVLIAAIMMIVYNFTLGSPLNLGMDFQGGYTIKVSLPTKMTSDNINEYKKNITAIIEELKDDDDKAYNLKVSAVQELDERKALLFKYKAIGDTNVMEEVNTKLETELNEKILADDKYGGQIIKGDIVSSSISSELLINAALAIAFSIVLMLVYIAFRFEISSGLSAIVALFHDIIIMFSFMVIFRVEINGTFIAALITILGYSINNTIIIFDRVRENMKSLHAKSMKAATIANNSVRETIWRSINTTLTTLITIGMIAIIGVPSIRIFALPIIIGLLAGTYSSICIAPSVWATWKDRKKKNKAIDTPDKKADKPKNVKEAPAVNQN